MRQRVTQLEAMLRSFIEPTAGGESSGNHSETPSSQVINEGAKVLSALDSTKKSQNDNDMNDEETSLDESNPCPGKLTLDNMQTSYVGSAHWGAVLNEVHMISYRLEIESPDFHIHGQS
jgi:hypothetical protein